MNIDKIVKDCPDAWGEWCEYINYDNDNEVQFIDNCIEFGIGTQEYIHYRQLFDYFDSVKIYIETEIIGNNYWKCSVYCEVNQGFVPITNADNRTKAEFGAIPSAFEIRQQQIEQNSKEN